MRDIFEGRRVFLQDESTHWYCIPVPMKEKFDKYLCCDAKFYDDNYWECGEVIEEFKQYRIDSPSFYSVLVIDKL